MKKVLNVFDLRYKCYVLQIGFILFTDEYSIQKGITKKKHNNKVIHHIHVYVVIQIIFKINNINIKAFQSAKY